MLSLPAGLVSAKNSWQGDGIIIPVIKVEIPTILVIPMRLAANEVDIVWKDPDTGTSETWIAFPFEIDDFGEKGKGEMPQLSLRVCNIGRSVQGYVDQANGALDATVTLHVINAANLTEENTFITMQFQVSGTSCDEEWCTFTLTATEFWRRQFPKNKCLKNFCRFKFKDVFCGYVGVETICNRSLARCRELSNSSHFGGFPSIGYDGLRIG